MQIRELDLKELETAYSVVCQLRKNLTYNDFEDLIYDMRHSNYKMFGIFERGELVHYSGVAITTTLKDKRHLCVYDFITSNKYDAVKYDQLMSEYLQDYANTSMCEKIVFTKESKKEFR